MAPQNLVLEQLRAIRAAIEGNGERLDGLRDDVRANGARLDGVDARLDRSEGHLEVVAGEVSKIHLQIEWLRARIGAASTQASVADTGRARLEARLDELARRVDALEADG